MDGPSRRLRMNRCSLKNEKTWRKGNKARRRPPMGSLDACTTTQSPRTLSPHDPSVCSFEGDIGVVVVAVRGVVPGNSGFESLGRRILEKESKTKAHPREARTEPNRL